MRSLLVLHTGLAQFYAHFYIAWIFINSLFLRQPNYLLVSPIGRQYDLLFYCMAGEFQFVSCAVCRLTRPNGVFM